jgi:hypothetical protein
MQPESTQKKILCYKKYKNSRNFLDEKTKCQPWITKKKPKMDENKIEIGKIIIITSMMWMNVKIFASL